AHRIDQLRFRHGALCLRLRLQVLAAARVRSCEFAAEREVLDGDLAFGLLVRTLDHRARRVALVGVFELLADAVLGVAEIKLGADGRIAQLRDEFLVVGDAVLVEHGDHHWAGRGFFAKLADQRKRSLQPRYTNGKAGRRYRLA